MYQIRKLGQYSFTFSWLTRTAAGKDVYKLCKRRAKLSKKVKKKKKQAHVEAEGPRRGFSASGWNDILPSTPNAHSWWELDQQSLTNIMAMNATIWRSTKTETTQVSPLGLLELDLKNGIFNSSNFSENSVENGGGGGGGGGDGGDGGDGSGGLIGICTLTSEAPDAISAVWYWVTSEQLWGVWIEGNDFGFTFIVAGDLLEKDQKQLRMAGILFRRQTKIQFLLNKNM